MEVNEQEHIIRKLTPADYDKYLIMINEFRKTFYTYEQFIDTLNYINHFSEIWVIEKDNDIIAMGTILYEKKFIHDNCTLAHIEDICVKEKYRKSGIGKIIVTHLMQLSKKNKCYKVTLDCSESNSGFYTKCGMEKVGLQMSQLTSKY